jgi:hypothetical protein
MSNNGMEKTNIDFKKNSNKKMTIKFDIKNLRMKLKKKLKFISNKINSNKKNKD